MAISSNQISAQTMPPIEAGVSHELAKWRAANYSDMRYKLNLTLEKMSPVLRGTIEISLQNNADLIVLDWRKIRGKEDLSKISNLSVNGRLAYFEEINEHLVLKEGVLKGKPNIIKLNFTSPIATSGAAITRYVDREDGAEYIYSLFVPSDASTAFPVFDQPNLKARFTTNILVPDVWKAISNTQGIVSEPTEDYKEISKDKTSVTLEKTWVKSVSFPETKPISTYVFAFAAGDFAEFTDKQSVIPSHLYVRKSQARKLQLDNWSADIIVRPFAKQTNTNTLKAVNKNRQNVAPSAGADKDVRAPIEEVFRLNREGVKFLESWFDYKFPFPKYDLVLIPEFPFGGMEHAGATFLREDRIIFPTEPTKNDYVTRANVIFHEAAHQWFGDTVTMRWFDDLWLKEGFAEFMAYKTLEKVMPEYNAWKIFYERNKQAAYLTDSTKGTTPIYQEIPNLSAAKSAYGNIVYRKAPSFLRQTEFYLGEDKFQIAVRAFLKKHEFANAEWTDLVKEFETASKQDLKDWANVWVKKRGMPIINSDKEELSVYVNKLGDGHEANINLFLRQKDALGEDGIWNEKLKFLTINPKGEKQTKDVQLIYGRASIEEINFNKVKDKEPKFIFPNYQDYGYGIFLLDETSRRYVLANIQNEKDDFLRTMMWGTLWDSVRETELAPKDYVELVIKNVNLEPDESTVQTLLGRVSTAMNYYLSEPFAVTSDSTRKTSISNSSLQPSATADGSDLGARLEKVLLERMNAAETLGLRITFYRAFLNTASTEQSRQVLKYILSGKLEIQGFKLKTKVKFDIVTRLLILDDADAPKLLAELEKTETSDEAKRYAYAARAGIATAENKAKLWNDFVNDEDLSESYIESAFVPFNSIRHADLTLPYLEKALAELPSLKRSRKIFFVNVWLAAFIGGQRDEKAFALVNKFLADNPNLDRDLRLKILEVSDNLERSIKIRQRYKN